MNTNTSIKKLLFLSLTILFLWEHLPEKTVSATERYQLLKKSPIIHISGNPYMSRSDVKEIYTLIASLDDSRDDYSPAASTIAERQKIVDKGVTVMENFGSDIVKKLIQSFKNNNGKFLYSHDQQHSAMYDKTDDLISFGSQVWEIDNIWSYPGIDKVIAYIIHEIAHTAMHYNENTRNLTYRAEEAIANKFTFTQKKTFNENMGIILSERRRRALDRKIDMYSKYADLAFLLKTPHRVQAVADLPE